MDVAALEIDYDAIEQYGYITHNETIMLESYETASISCTLRHIHPDESGSSFYLEVVDLMMCLGDIFTVYDAYGESF